MRSDGALTVELKVEGCRLVPEVVENGGAGNLVGVESSVVGDKSRAERRAERAIDGLPEDCDVGHVRSGPVFEADGHFAVKTLVVVAVGDGAVEREHLAGLVARFTAMMRRAVSGLP